MVVINQIVEFPSGSQNTTQDVNVTEPNSTVLVFFSFSAGATVSNVQFNGGDMTIVAPSATNSSQNANVWAIKNPPIGTYPVFIGLSAASTLVRGFALVIPNASTKQTNILGATSSGSTGGATEFSITPFNSSDVDQNDIVIHYVDSSNAITNKAEQKFLIKDSTTHGIIYQPPGNGFYTFTTSAVTTWATATVLLRLSQAPSTSFPNLRDRSFPDIQPQNKLDQISTPTSGTFGYFSPTFYKNSFLHTIGRLGGGSFASGPYGIVGPELVQSQIVIDQIINSSSNSGANFIGDIEVTNPDAVIVALLMYPAGPQASGQFVNGNIMTQIFNQTIAGSTCGVAAYIYTEPPVGSNTVQVNTASSGFRIVIMSVLGVDKNNPNINFVSKSVLSNNLQIDLNITPTATNSMLLDVYTTDNAFPTVNVIPISPSQIPIYELTADVLNPSGVTMLLANNMNPQTMGWKLSGVKQKGIAYGIIELRPSKAYSIWNSSIRFRNNQDLIKSNSLNTSENISGLYGHYPSTFFLNSFLHTVGRFPVIAGVVTLNDKGFVSVTSQIIIDKIYQAQVGGGATLTMDVNIPSSDAVLVVTGGSVIATGGAWVNVQLNGVSLTKLAAATVVGADAEIWWTPQPPVGTYQLTITPTAVTGQVYANAMVLLGVDKRSTNIVTTSVTDAAATSTISSAITPDASNSLIIASLSSLDATQRPTYDASQTQVLNATPINASEYVMTTYQLEDNNSDNQFFNLGAAVNAALVVASFRPAKAASMWSPNINLRELNDVVRPNSLDAGVSPVVGNYGYKTSNFFLNSFLHTIGRITPSSITRRLISYLAALGAG